MSSYDIFIPITNKDYNKLKFLVKSIEENLNGYKKIYVTSPEGDKIYDHPDIIYFKDKDILDIDPQGFAYRPGWLYQMYLKMFQGVTSEDMYLTIDSDVIFNRPLDMFTAQGKPVMYLGWEQHHRPYFCFQEKLLGLTREYPHTFINDMNFFSKRIIAGLLDRYGYSVDSFVKASMEIITDKCYPAEPEIYGQFVMKYHSDMYEIKQLKTIAWNPRSQNHIPDTRAQVWSDEEIAREIEVMKTQDYDMFMLHSWLDNNVYNWK